MIVLRNWSAVAWAVLGVLAACGGIGWWNARAAEQEFCALLTRGGSSHIEEVIFIGQQKRVVVTDAETLRSLEEAIRNPQSAVPNLASFVYEVRITFRTGHKYNTFVYINCDGGGIDLPNIKESQGCDQLYAPIRFAKPVAPRIKSLVEELVTHPRGPKGQPFGVQRVSPLNSE